MKQVLFIFMLFPCLLFSIIENLQHEDTIIHGVKYEATLLEKNDRLYVDAIGAIEEYYIHPNGSLELVSFISKTHYTIANAKIMDNILYVSNSHSTISYTDIYRIDISDDQMQLIDIQTIDTGYGLFRFDVNNDYFIYVNYSEIDARVLNRETFEYITTIEAGGFFEVKDSLLFRSMTNGYLSIMDISDIENPVEISSVYIGDYEQNIAYYFHDGYLIIGQENRLSIINITNPANPQLITNIENIPSVPIINFFTDIVVYENFLIFQNQYINLWVYDISEISHPIFLALISSFSSGLDAYKQSSLLQGEYLYLTGRGLEIMQLNVSQLPAIELISAFGNYGQFHFFKYKDPYIFFNNPLTGKFRFFNVYEQNANIDTLYDDDAYTYCFNDSIMCFIDAVSNNNSDLVICAYNDEEIVIRNSLNLGYLGYSVEFVGEHLIITQKNPGIVRICDLLNDYTIELLAEHQVELRPFVAPATSYCSDNYIYIISKNYDLNISYLNIYENFGDFSEVSNSNLNLFGRNFDRIYRLSDERIILSDNLYPEHEYVLCEYIFPNNFEFTANLMTTGSISLHDHFFVWHEDFKTGTKIYSWQNDEFDEIFSYDFECEISDIFIIPDTNMLYGVGRYTVVKYSFEYTGAEESEIPYQNFQLSNHPNPFNPSTTISYNIIESGKVDLSIYNIKGQIVKQLIDEELPAGQHFVIWDGTNDAGKPVASGVYYYQLKAGSQMLQNKALLLK